MAKITFILYEQCMFSGIVGISDALAIANRWQQYLKKADDPKVPNGELLFESRIVSPGGRPVMTEGGIPIVPQQALEDVKDTDLILIPPYMRGHTHLPGEIPVILEWIVSRYESGTRVGAMCTGVFLLAMTGLLDGRLATTNWLFADNFQKRFPEVRLKPERVLTEDNGLICSGAATAMYNLALHVIEIFGSGELFRCCAKSLLVDPSRQTQTPYRITNFWKSHGDKEVLKAQEWMEDHYGESITVDDAASNAGLSPRHFKRRFKKATGEKPLAYLQQVRLEAAKKMLETTANNMEEITRQVGYEDSSTFRRLFNKYTSLSPREYRDKFSTNQMHQPGSQH